MAAREAGLLSLPTEILIRVFSHLPVCDLVLGVRPTCQYFHRLSRMPELWKHVEIRHTDFNPACSTSDKFYSHLIHQKCLAAARSDDESDAGRDALQVRTVATSVEERGEVWPECSVTGQIFYPMLQNLTLKRQIPQLDFLRKYDNLLHLHIRLERRENVQDFFDILQGFKRLQALTFILFHKSCRKPSKLVAAKPIIDYFQSRPELRQIHLEFHVTRDIVRTILEHCSELEDLFILKCSLTSEVFKTVCEKPSASLSSLRLAGDRSLDDRCLGAMARALPALKTLELIVNGKTTMEGMTRLLGGCSHLTKLQLSTVQRYHSGDNTDDDRFGDGTDKDDVDETNEDGSNHDVGTDDSDNSVDWDLEWDVNRPGKCFFPARFLQGLAREQTGGNLKSLTLYNCLSNGAAVFTALCQNQPNLRVVKLRRCKINDSDVIAMGKHCPLLKNVELFECGKVSSRAISALMNHLHWLLEFRCNTYVEDLATSSKEQPPRKRTRSGTLCELKKKKKTIHSGLQSLLIRSFNLDFALNGRMAFSVSSPNLVSLTIVQNVYLDDNCFEKILRSFDRLQELRIQDTPAFRSRRKAQKLTDDGLRHILAYGHHLRTVQLPHCHLMTNPALAKVIVRSPQLARFCFGIYGYEKGRALCFKDGLQVREVMEIIKKQLNQFTGEKKAIQCVCPAPETRASPYVTYFIRRLRASHSTESWVSFRHC